MIKRVYQQQGDELVEFAPVRHGYWTLVRLNDWELKWECSICKSQENTEDDGMGEIYDPTPYCPNCGSQMDLEG